MKNQVNLLSIITLIFFTVTITLGITACTMKEKVAQGDKDIAEITNETHLDDSTNTKDVNFLNIQCSIVRL